MSEAEKDVVTVREGRSEDVNMSRRGLAGLLGLFGAGAALSRCIGSGDDDPAIVHAAQAATGSGVLWVDQATDLKVGANAGSAATGFAVAPGRAHQICLSSRAIAIGAIHGELQSPEGRRGARKALRDAA